MKVKCIKNVEVNGTVVYSEGEVYECNKTDEQSLYEVKCGNGVGFWSEDELNEHFSEVSYKVFKFTHSEGAEIIAADNAKNAVMYFFTKYIDKDSTEDMIKYDSVIIKEVADEQLDKQHLIFDEEVEEGIHTSYRALADKYFNGNPIILVSPNY
ncbi:hypothetical protein V1503_19355 [Bacillus sp. SCS-151]|uniref:hypothetical protein n=1 Tax=Nanhaiella sioensis TaxID=3115293 RepID=UPI00397D5038